MKIGPKNERSPISKRVNDLYDSIVSLKPTKLMRPAVTTNAMGSHRFCFGMDDGNPSKYIAAMNAGLNRKNMDTAIEEKTFRPIWSARLNSIPNVA